MSRLAEGSGTGLDEILHRNGSGALEEAVLGEILLVATDRDRVGPALTEVLRPSMFPVGPGRTVFRAQVAAFERGDSPDAVTLLQDLREAGENEAAELVRFLLCEEYVPAALPGHARQLRELDALRRAQAELADTATPARQRLHRVRMIEEELDPGLGIQFLDEREVDEIPDAEALVGHRHNVIIPARSLVMVEGESGAWKTFVGVVEVGMAVQNGVDCAFGPTRQGQVVLVAGEGAPGLKKRFAAWRADRGGLNYGGLLVLKDPPKLNRPEGVARVLKALRSLPEPPALLEVDTVNTSIEGSENDREDAGAFMDFGRAVRDEFGATVLYVHHMNAEGRKHRGHTSFFDDADCVIRMVKEGENQVRAECRKMKDAPPFDPFHLELVPCADSLVVRKSATGSAADRRDAPEYIRATLRQLSKSVPEGEGLATSKWEGICREELDLSSSTFYRHRTMLIRGEFVRQEEVAGGVRNHLTTRGEEWLS